MADTYNYPAPKPEFDMGRVINRTFGAIKNNFINFFLASVIIMGVPMFLISLMPIFFSSGGMLDGNEINQAYMTGMMTMSFVSVFVVLIGSILLQGALIFGAVADFNGYRAPFGDCMSVALRYFFPLLGLAILVFFGVFFGMLLLIIPGLLAALGWAIAAPILIVEQRGVFDSISRSWQLTKGYKRWILLLAIIYSVISAIIGGVLTAFTLIAGDPTTAMLEGGSTTFYILNAFFSGLTQALTTMISAIGVAAIYFELRQIREGAGAESLAAVFD